MNGDDRSSLGVRRHLSDAGMYLGRSRTRTISVARETGEWLARLEVAAKSVCE